MTQTCTVYGCASRKKYNPDLKFHTFPNDDRCETWVNACQRPDLREKSQEQLRNMYVCSLHFEEWMKINHKLNKAAIPVLNLPDDRVSIQPESIKEEPLEDFLKEGVQNEIDTSTKSISTETCDGTGNETPQALEQLANDTLIVEDPVDLVAEDPLAPSLYDQELDLQAKVIIISIVRYMKLFTLPEAKSRGQELDMEEEVAKAAGVSVATVKQTLAEYHNGSLKKYLIERKHGKEGY